VTFAFTGTAVAGKTVLIKPKVDITVDSVLMSDFSFVIPAQATLAVKAGSVIEAADENPSLIVVLTNDTFKDTGVTTASNWTYAAGTSGLTINTITQSGNEVTFLFAGTAESNKAIEITAKAAILTNGRNSKKLTYTTTTAA
jgi:hypothetical protein